MPYLFGSRILTHALFWVIYYLAFSLIWAVPDRGYFASFYLEFILMPVRILSVYCMLYWLIPNYLAVRQFKGFVIRYFVLIAIAGLFQLFFSYFFYSNLMPQLSTPYELTFSGWARSSILINTTVILLGAMKILKMYLQIQEELALVASGEAEVKEHIEVKSDRKMHRIKVQEILYLQGMGNYVTYYISGGQKRVVYVSLKQALAELPSDFMRVHRSYVVNKLKIDSYNQDELFIGETVIPRGKEVTDEDLSVSR